MASQHHGAARRSSARRTAVAAIGSALFVVAGTGTPAPGAPTERLVIGGLYRYVRNPMYLAVATIIEEPLLESACGTEYRAYKRAVRARWPRLHPWEPSSASAPQ